MGVDDYDYWLNKINLLKIYPLNKASIAWPWAKHVLGLPASYYKWSWGLV